MYSNFWFNTVDQLCQMSQLICTFTNGTSNDCFTNKCNNYAYQLQYYTTCICRSDGTPDITKPHIISCRFSETLTSFLQLHGAYTTPRYYHKNTHLHVEYIDDHRLTSSLISHDYGIFRITSYCFCFTVTLEKHPVNIIKNK